LNSVKKHTLQNGMPIFTLERQGLGLVSFWLWYRVGSRNEMPGATGLSHWVEHMMFKGTPTYPAATLDKLINESGGHWNAFTTADATAYFTTLPVARLEALLRIECDRMVNTLFSPNEVENERNVILAELAGYENQPEYWLEEAVESAAYTKHPYRQSILGTREDLRNITAAQLYAHYQRYYQPTNALAVIVGDFNTPMLLEQMERTLGQLAPAPVLRQEIPIEPPQQEQRIVTIKRPGPTAYLDIAYHVPAANHPERVTLMLIDSLLTGGKPPSSWNGGKEMGRSSLLYQLLVDGDLATDVYSEAHPTIDPGLFRINVTLRPHADLVHVESLVLDTVAQLANMPVADAELERARKQCRAQLAYAQESAESTALLLGAYAITGAYDYLAYYQDHLDACSAEDIQRVAATYLHPNNCTIGRFIPDLEQIDTGAEDIDDASESATMASPTVTAVDADTNQTDDNAVVSAVTLQKARQAAGLTLYTPESLKSTLPGCNRIQRIELQTGVTALVYSSSSRTVTFKVAAPAGSAYENSEQAGLAYLLNSTLLRGTRQFSGTELHKLTDAMGMSLSVSCDEEFASLEISCLAEDARLAAELLAEVWLTPSLSDRSIQQEQGKLLAAIGEREDDARAVADRLWQEVAYANHCFAHPVDGYAHTVRGLLPDQCRRFHTEHYLSAPITLCVAGGINPQQAVDLLGQLWCQTIKTNSIRPALDDLVPAAKGANQCLYLAGKSQTDITLGLPTLPYNAVEYPAFFLGNLILGRLGLYGRLGARVREQLGLAYYVYSGLQPKAIASPWAVRAGVDPTCIEAACDAILQEIRKITTKPVLKTELAEAVGYVLGSLPSKLECSDDLADTLLDMEMHNLGLDYLQTFQERVINTTVEDVQAALAKYLQIERFSRAVVGPCP
jgi:zinc protease